MEKEKKRNKKKGEGEHVGEEEEGNEGSKQANKLIVKWTKNMNRNRTDISAKKIYKCPTGT